MDNIDIDIEYVLYHHHRELIKVLESIRTDLQHQSFKSNNAETHQEKLDAWKPYSDKFYDMKISDLERITLKYPRGVDK